ncbi:hypothetical protein Nmel_007154 [Mimus melanotis]
MEWSLLGAAWSLLGTAWSLLAAVWSLLVAVWSLVTTAWSLLVTAWSLLAATWSVLATAWSLLASAFLGALMVLQQDPGPRRGGADPGIPALLQDLLRYGKTKRGSEQLPKWLQVPKRWGTEERTDCERSYRIPVFHIGTKA